MFLFVIVGVRVYASKCAGAQSYKDSKKIGKCKGGGGKGPLGPIGPLGPLGLGPLGPLGRLRPIGLLGHLSATILMVLRS